MTTPEFHAFLEQETDILYDLLTELGYDVTLEDCAELVIDYGNWEKAAQFFCREQDAPHPSLTLEERNR